MTVEMQTSTGVHGISGLLGHIVAHLPCAQPSKHSAATHTILMQLFSSKVLGRSVAISIATISTALSALHHKRKCHSGKRTLQMVVLDKLLAAHNGCRAAVRPARGSGHSFIEQCSNTWGSTAAWSMGREWSWMRGSARACTRRGIGRSCEVRRVTCMPGTDGLLTECLWFFQAILAKCSFFVPAQG